MVLMDPECQAYKVDMEGRMSTVEEWVREMRDNHMPHITSELTAIQSRLNRPTWFATMLISGLFSLCVGLLVTLVR